MKACSVIARGVGSDRSGLWKVAAGGRGRGRGVLDGGGRLRFFLDGMGDCLLYDDGEGAGRSERRRLHTLLRAAEVEGDLSVEMPSTPGWLFTFLLLRVELPTPPP